MPRTVPDSLLTQARAQTNAPIWLYRIAVTDNAAEDLFLAEWHENVSFFKDTDTAQVYTAFALAHGGITQNTEGQTDTLTVTLANVNLAIQAYLETNDALRGRKVTIRQVFEDDLAEPSAYIEDAFWVDSVTVTQDVATFSLVPRVDMLRVVVPSRTFSRAACQNVYRMRGCWIADDEEDWVEPADFDADDGSGGGGDVCNHSLTDCVRHSNKLRYGGFPSVPRGRVIRA